MSNEQREALKIAIPFIHEKHPRGDYPCIRCRRLAAALLEARADGMNFCRRYMNDGANKNMKAQEVSLRAEAAELRSK